MSVLNLNDADKLYYGNTEVEKLYKGSELLYPLVGGNFSPLDLSPALWLDADDNSTLTLVSGAVSEWRDKSGNNCHATQTNASNRPLFVANELNGTDVIRFGTQLINRFLNVSGLNLLDNCSIFISFKSDELNNQNANNKATFVITISEDLVNENTRYSQISMNGDNIFRFIAYNPSGVTSSINHPRNTNWNLHTQLISFNNNNTYLLNGGSLSTTVSNGARRNIGNLMTIGIPSFGNTFGMHFIGDFSQIIIFPRVLTTAEREQVEGYLAWSTGLQDNLPNDHPYKNIAP